VVLVSDEEKKFETVPARRIVSTASAVKAADRFLWHVAEGLLQLDVAQFDRQQFAALAQTESDQEPSLSLFVTDRFLLSPVALVELQKAVDAAVQHFKSLGFNLDQFGKGGGDE
jgi:hypothetical protein